MLLSYWLLVLPLQTLVETATVVGEKKVGMLFCS